VTELAQPGGPKSGQGKGTEWLCGGRRRNHRGGKGQGNRRAGQGEGGGTLGLGRGRVGMAREGKCRLCMMLTCSNVVRRSQPKRQMKGAAEIMRGQPVRSRKDPPPAHSVFQHPSGGGPGSHGPTGSLPGDADAGPDSGITMEAPDEARAARLAALRKEAEARARLARQGGSDSAPVGVSDSAP
jgi:hypothetical protein